MLTKSTAGGTVAVALGLATLLFAQPAFASDTALVKDDVYSMQQFNSISVEDIERELEYLESLSDEEIANLFNSEGTQFRVAPLAIVAAIGCAVSGGSAIFATDWDSAESVAWTLAGLLTSCIPGVQQAKLVSVILNHKGTIGRALKAVGATGAAATLTGDTAQQ